MNEASKRSRVRLRQPTRYTLFGTRFEIRLENRRRQNGKYWNNTAPLLQLPAVWPVMCVCKFCNTLKQLHNSLSKASHALACRWNWVGIMCISQHECKWSDHHLWSAIPPSAFSRVKLDPLWLAAVVNLRTRVYWLAVTHLQPVVVWSISPSFIKYIDMISDNYSSFNRRTVL